MVDCHMHMVLDGANWRSAIGRHSVCPDDGFIHAVLGAYRDAGFTWLRDGGDRWGVGKRARQLAVSYGIVYRTPLAPLCKRGHYGAFIGQVYDDLREYGALVVKQREAGADFIKIMISGLMDFDRFGVLTEEGLEDREIGELIHIAHEEGMSVMAHGNGVKNVLAAAKAGLDSLEHGAYLNDEALCALAEAGTVWVPTMSTVGNLRGRGRFDEGAVAAIWENLVANVSKSVEKHVLTAPGTDAGAWAVPHAGASEYEYLAALVPSAVQEAAICRLREKF